MNSFKCINCGENKFETDIVCNNCLNNLFKNKKRFRRAKKNIQNAK